jgi:CRP-like cAMP-binding protein
LLNRLKDNIESEFVFSIFTISKVIAMLLCTQHFVGSAWYGLGNVTKEDGQPSWIDQKDLVNESIAIRYFTSLHWSLSNYGLASSAFFPKNSLEYVFAIFNLIIGMIFFWFMTAFITTSLTLLRSSQMEGSKQMWLLRRYLRQHKTSSGLSYRVLRNAERACKLEKASISDTKLPVLDRLSEQLRVELKFSVAFAPINAHPLFEVAYDLSEETLTGLAGKGMHLVSFAQNDVVFNQGKWATDLYYLVDGEMQYAMQRSGQGQGSSARVVQNRGMDKTQLVTGDWLCEQAMWTRWMTRGTVQAEQDCLVIKVNVQAFGDVVRNDAPLFAAVSNYAENFVEWMNGLDPQDLVDYFVGKPSRKLHKQFLRPRENSGDEE